MIFIPAGDFIMGINDPGLLKSNPQRTVYLDAYWIDQTEVSNKMYALCVQAGGCGAPIQSEEVNPYYDNRRYDNYPIIYINWTQAMEYCTWAGRRLPTEAEWEKAARGTDGRPYPWGNEAPDPSRANYGDFIGEPLPVDRYPAGASPYGVLNMAGNVREWVADWFDPHYYAVAPDRNPKGPDGELDKSLRGGSYADSARQMWTFVRFSHYLISAGAVRGFRCAADG